MADSIAKLVVSLEAQTAAYQAGMERAQAQNEKFHRSTTATLNSVSNDFKSFGEKTLKSLEFLTKFAVGGGLAVGIAGLVHHLTTMAEKLADVDPRAREFAETMERLRGTVQSGFLVVFSAINPILKGVADGADGASSAYQRLTEKINESINAQREFMRLRDAQASAAERRLNEQPGVSQTTTRGEATAAGFGNNAFFQSLATLKALGIAEANAVTEAQHAEIQKRVAFEIEASDNAINKILEDRERAAKSLAQYNEDLVAARIKVEQDATDKINAYNEETVQTRMKNQEKAFEEAAKKQADDEAALSESLGKEAVDAKKRINEQAAAFGDLFTENLVQAADEGFDAVLRSWARTLEQMVLRATGITLFKSLFSGAAEGSWQAELASIFGGGRAAGGPVMAGVPYMVGEQGPEMFVPRSSGNIVPNGAGGVTIVQNIDARGAQDPAQVAFAAKMGKQQAIAEIRNSQRRGRK